MPILRLRYLIYNSRNYQSLLASNIQTTEIYASTIVEIIRAYQPTTGLVQMIAHLQQQKLLELTSLLFFKSLFTLIYNSRNYQSLLAVIVTFLIWILIYNSRNYQSLLALLILSLSWLNLQQQKLLELTSHYQAIYDGLQDLQQQKLLELTSPYQHIVKVLSYLQQQKLLELTSLTTWIQSDLLIYNSRNYQSLLA